MLDRFYRSPHSYLLRIPSTTYSDKFYEKIVPRFSSNFSSIALPFFSPYNVFVQHENKTHVSD